MDDLQTVIRETIAATFALPPLAVTATTSRQDVAGWDSLGHIGLILAVEQRFGVSIPVDRIARLTSVPALCDEVAALTAAPAATVGN